MKEAVLSKNENIWGKIKREYESTETSFVKLSKKYGYSKTGIWERSRKEGWNKGVIPKMAAEKAKEELTLILSKSIVEVNKEADDILEIATEGIKSVIKSNVKAVDLNLSVSSLQIIRKERLEIRGELRPAQKIKAELDKAKFDHKVWLDGENLKVKKNKKSNKKPGDREPEGNGVYID